MKKGKAMKNKISEECKLPRKRGRPKRRKEIDDDDCIPPPPPKFSGTSSGSSENCNPCAEKGGADIPQDVITEHPETKPTIEKARSFSFSIIAGIMNHDSHNIDNDEDDVVVSFVHPALINVQGYYVKQETVSLLKKIIKTHGDIGGNCEIKCGKSRGLFIEMMCSVYKKLEETSLKEITEIELDGMLAIVNVLQNANFDVKWLSERLKDISGIQNLFKEHSLMKKEEARKTEAILKKEKEIDEYKEKLFMAEGELVILKDEFDTVNRVNKSLMEKGCVFWKTSLVHGLV